MKGASWSGGPGFPAGEVLVLLMICQLEVGRAGAG